MNLPSEGTIFLSDVDAVDCGIATPDDGVIGQSWSVDVEVSGSLDSNGFVADFGILKKDVKKLLRQLVDHKLLVPNNISHLAIPPSDEQRLNFLKTHFSGTKIEKSEAADAWVLKYAPRLDVMHYFGDVSFSDEVSAHGCFTRNNGQGWMFGGSNESIQFLPFAMHSVNSIQSASEDFLKMIEKWLSTEFSRRLGLKVKIQLSKGSEESGFGFNYTHGITGHDGACQRIFHGHSSRVEITVGDKRIADQVVKDSVFDKRNSIHVLSKEQILWQTDERYLAGYLGTEGAFLGGIPRNKVFVVDGPPSIENLTCLIAKRFSDNLLKEISMKSLSKNHVGKPVKTTTKCFEGVSKGAIFSSAIDLPESYFEI